MTFKIVYEYAGSDSAMRPFAPILAGVGLSETLDVSHDGFASFKSLECNCVAATAANPLNSSIEICSCTV